MTKNNPSFTERLQTAAKAKKAQIAKAHKNNPANAPDYAERQAQRLVISEARDKRKEALAEKKRADIARKAEEKAAAAVAKQQAAEAEKAANEAALNQKAVDALALKAKQKAGRDAKYAARKARRDNRGTRR